MVEEKITRIILEILKYKKKTEIEGRLGQK